MKDAKLFRQFINIRPSTCARILPLVFAAVAALTTLLPGSAVAANLLANPSFEANSGHAIPTGWKRYAPPTEQAAGNYWIESAVKAHSGTLYWKQWGAVYNAAVSNIAGIYQDFSSSPGSVYQASGWFYTRGSDLLGTDCATWIELDFYDSNTNLLALYKSEDFTADAGADTWLEYPVTLGCDPSIPIPSGDPYFTTYAVTGAVSQILAPPGTKTVRYRYAYKQAGNHGGSAYLDDALLEQVSGPLPPAIANISPLNMIFANPTNGLTFTVSSPSGYTLPNTGIGVVLNGTNVSANLVISGSPSNKTVSYFGLLSNAAYTASITVTDAFGFTAGATTYFETMWLGIPPVKYLWEAEDFDFEGGHYINNPELCNAPGNPNCYFGKVGVPDVDEQSQGASGNHYYRADDPVPIGVSGDYLRKNLADAGRLDYRIDPFLGGAWLNYTRDWPTGTFWVIARVATGEGLSGSLTLSQVNGDGSTTDLGTFSVANGRGWTAYDNVFLRDTNGNIANITLSGKATLRVTSGGNLLPNFFALAAGQADLPIISNLYPAGGQPFEFSTNLSFTVSTLGSSFPANGITVFVDNRDVSSSLVLSGSDSLKNVTYPALAPNAIHTTVINATNALGHGISVTNTFDTFTQDNYTFEAEDFNFDSGQFIADWTPDAYANLGATTNIDFQHSPIDGEQYAYRPTGIPQEKAEDFRRDVMVTWGGTDYQLAWFGAGDWADYTRNFPSNTYNLYVRSGGFGAYSMELDRVTSGAGTETQTLSRLGVFRGVGRDNQTHAWVPLTVEATGALAVVPLGGTNTLRLSTSTGNCHPNFLMLVPAAAPVADISLGITRNATNIVLSVPTQAGSSYRIQYRDDLLTGTWLDLTSIQGDGSVRTVTDAISRAHRFYRVVSP